MSLILFYSKPISIPLRLKTMHVLCRNKFYYVRQGVTIDCYEILFYFGNTRRAFCDTADRFARHVDLEKDSSARVLVVFYTTRVERRDARWDGNAIERISSVLLVRLARDVERLGDFTTRTIRSEQFFDDERSISGLRVSSRTSRTPNPGVTVTPAPQSASDHIKSLPITSI